MKSRRRNVKLRAEKFPSARSCLVAQQSLFDETRAPRGQHTLWAYCHIPFNCGTDMSDQIESQIERFAPGFRDCILARHKMCAADLARSNRNLTGGDISGGAANLTQLIARPILSPTPYRTPLPGVYLCSASTPPGGGVHGMCGYHAASVALRDNLLRANDDARFELSSRRSGGVARRARRSRVPWFHRHVYDVAIASRIYNRRAFDNRQ